MYPGYLGSLLLWSSGILVPLIGLRYRYTNFDVIRRFMLIEVFMAWSLIYYLLLGRGFQMLNHCKMILLLKRVTATLFYADCDFARS
jgi:hypothetical protein